MELIGRRVRVEIDNMDRWNLEAATALNGKAGTIRQMNTRGQVLVEFDTRAEPFGIQHQGSMMFWFTLDDLNKGRYA